MSRTVGNDWWNQSARYHLKREQFSKGQVEDTIFPTFKKYMTSMIRGQRGFYIADFACGGGSIAREFADKCVKSGIDISKFVLIDVVPDNLDAATNRLAEILPRSAIENYLCDGQSFAGYRGTKVDFLYCWDAMVHFDILDVVGYLRTLRNITNGFAFFHHSNFCNVTTDVRQNPHWRNFMSKDIFKQLSLSSGHEVLEQRLIDWGSEPMHQDCLTTVAVKSF